MQTEKIIQSLRTMADKSKAANDLFHSFATRTRTRSQITLGSLCVRMNEEGFKHSAEEYGDVLKALGDLGFGTIKLSKRGKVVGLFGIKTKLQSIGDAAVGRRTRLQNTAPRNRYSPIAVGTPVPASETTQAITKDEVVKSLSTASNLVKTIISDTSISPEKKTNVILALLAPEVSM